MCQVYLIKEHIIHWLNFPINRIEFCNYNYSDANVIHEKLNSLYSSYTGK